MTSQGDMSPRPKIFRLFPTVLSRYSQYCKKACYDVASVRNNAYICRLTDYVSTMNNLLIELRHYQQQHTIMRKTLFTGILAALLLGSSAPAMQAQTVDVDRTKYTDYTPVNNPDWSLMPAAREAGATARNRAASGRPDHVNNALTRHFPPVFNQDGGSCGSASRISYMFSYELAAYRDLDGSKAENYYPSHFVWLHTNSPGSPIGQGKNEFVMHVGVPSAATYGGQTYSSLFGNQDAGQNDFGWMQGYDKWFEAMHNRMLSPVNFPVNVGSEEGREAVKNWLWNHNGDNDFAAGGICGIGVASGGVWKDIPKTATNDAIGVTGMGYVYQWGTQVDHALTIVGYDDRIEFDLDGDGKYGEADADELGAWIIVNSWGKGWENGGFIYCPYAHGVPAFNNDGSVPSNFWTPEIYKVRKNYRPLRTIKLEMDYSRRSEIALSAGISADLNATAPEKTTAFVHFSYAGDGNYGNSNPAPEIPMLGRWADGKLHTEPMEFGYDLTDLTDGYDMNRPLKYFFIVDTKSWAAGKGTIHGASIMDYLYDEQGLETPFNVGEGVEIKNAGGRTIISVVVYGSSYHAPQNAAFDGTTLTWQAPQRSALKVASYCIYRNGMLVDNVPSTTFAYTPKAVAASGEYSVTALYSDDHESAATVARIPVTLSSPNMGVNFSQAGFVIPDVFDSKYQQATIEYWIKPTTLTNWNQGGGPGWGNFMFHANAGGQFTAGWSTQDRLNTGTPLKTGQWSHVAIVVDGGKMTVYINGVTSGSVTTDFYRGIGGFGDLVFSSSNNAQDAVYDEIRIWNVARTAAQIKVCKDVEFTGSLMPQGLISYLKGDLVTGAEGDLVMYDCVGGHHATLQGSCTPVSTNMPTLSAAGGVPDVDINAPEGTVYAGVPVTLTATYNDAVNKLAWTISGAGIENLAVAAPTVVFTTTGRHIAMLTATTADNQTVTVEYGIIVEPTPEVDASFTMTADLVAAGERITFLAANPMDGYLYEWSMPGADIETAYTVNAATSYQAQGTYDVTLTVTSPDGATKSHTEQVKVLEVAPKAAFSIAPAVVLKGEEVTLTDESLYTPTQWEWHIGSDKANYIAYDQYKTLVVDKPGVYNVTLGVANNAGSSKLTRERALIVANADSKNGLLFSNDAATVTVGMPPISAGMTAFTIDWWMNAEWPADNTNGIGESEETMLLKTMGGGKMQLFVSGKSASTSDGYVISGEWHHYAVVFGSSKAQFYRDGELIITRPLTSITALPAIGTFRIGGSETPFQGSIDEMRVWGKTLTASQLCAYANDPITDVAIAENSNALKLYYNFNQSGGDVQDATSNANHGRRANFGPDGDAWGLSKGVFCLNFDETANADITSQYLTNYAASFIDNGKCINANLSSRTFGITGWTLENTATNGNIITGAHVDRGKNYCFTVTTGWDGFASTLSDHKAFQTITLPAGYYTLEATYDDKYEGQCGESYLVAAVGNTLPTTENLGQAIAYTAMKAKGTVTSNAVSFLLTTETTVSVGLLVNMNGNSCMALRQFTLTKNQVTVHGKSSDAVPSVSKLSNDRLYYISLPYHAEGLTSWAIARGGDCLQSNQTLGVTVDKDDTAQQFAILTGDEGATHYLYHAAEKKFVSKDGSLTDTPVDAIYFKEGAYDTTFVAYFDESHYVNIDADKQLAINSNATPDGNNSVVIRPAKTFNPAAALAKFPFVEVKEIALNHSSATLMAGEALELQAVVAPSYATDPSVTWSTSDATVAIVVRGVVTAVAPGKAVITAKAGDMEAVCEVTVEKRYIEVVGVLLSQTAASVIEGETLTLSAMVTPTDADDQTVTWETSDATVATIEDGMVTALAPGTVTITAKAGSRKATCVVTVNKRYVPVTEIILNYTELTLEVGESVTLTATVLPENADKKTVVWKSSDTKVASYSRKKVKAIAEGTAVISAETADLTVYCTVTVVAEGSGIDQVTDNSPVLMIYDVTGRPVRLHTKSTEGLDAGIYIINGRKTVVK